MSSLTVTPAEILSERRAREKAGVFAHTVETYGPECIWWVHCGCFGCRDHFDPEGVRDAWARTKNPDVRVFFQLTDEEREGAPDVKERNLDHLLDLILGSAPDDTKSTSAGMCTPGLSNETPVTEESEFFTKLEEVRRDVSLLTSLANTTAEPWRAAVLTNVTTLLNSI